MGAIEAAERWASPTTSAKWASSGVGQVGTEYSGRVKLHASRQHSHRPYRAVEANLSEREPWW